MSPRIEHRAGPVKVGLESFRVSYPGQITCFYSCRNEKFAAVQVGQCGLSRSTNSMFRRSKKPRLGSNAQGVGLKVLGLGFMIHG
jgi:hypothetical protein